MAKSKSKSKNRRRKKRQRREENKLKRESKNDGSKGQWTSCVRNLLLNCSRTIFQSARMGNWLVNICIILFNPIAS